MLANTKLLDYPRAKEAVKNDRARERRIADHSALLILSVSLVLSFGGAHSALGQPDPPKPPGPSFPQPPQSWNPFQSGVGYNPGYNPANNSPSTQGYSPWQGVIINPSSTLPPGSRLIDSSSPYYDATTRNYVPGPMYTSGPAYSQSNLVGGYNHGSQPPLWQGYLAQNQFGQVMTYYSDGRGGIAHWSSLANLANVMHGGAMNNYPPSPSPNGSFGATSPPATGQRSGYYSPPTSTYYPGTSAQTGVTSTYTTFSNQTNYQPNLNNQTNYSSHTNYWPSQLQTTVSAQARTLTNTGRDYFSSGQFEKALEVYTRALPLSQIAGDKIEQAVIYSSMAQTYLSMGEGKLALEHFDRAYLASQEAGDAKMQAFSLRGSGAAYLALGESGPALESYRRARSLVSDDQAAEAEIIASMGWVYQSAGELQKALEHYHKALPLMIKNGNEAAEARTRVGIGLLYHSLGEPMKAMEQYRKAIDIASQPAEIAGILTSAGEVYQSVGMSGKALECYEHAIPLMKSAGNKVGEAGARVSMARTYLSLGWPALDQYNEALCLMREAGNPAGEAGALAGIGEVYFWAALRGYADSRQTMSENFRKALKYHDDALSVMRATDNRGGEFGILTNMGLVYDSWDKPKKALDYYRKSIEVLEGMRMSARLEEFRTSLVQQSIDVYQRAILLHLRLKRRQEAFELSERARARTFLDKLGNSRLDVRKGLDAQAAAQEQELRRQLSALEKQLWQEMAKPAFQVNRELIQSLETRLAAGRGKYEDLLTRLKLSNPEYASLISVDTLTLPQAQKLLGQDVTLLSYFVTPDTTLAFVIARESFHVAKLSVNERDLVAAVAGFRDFSSLSEVPPPNLKQLYKWLIAPIESHVKTSLIGIVPHGVLHKLPFAALTDGRRYLGDKHTIFHLPSVSALPFIRQKHTAGGAKALALAYGEGEGLPFLRYAGQEAQAVAGLYHTQARIGSAATKSAFRASAGEYDILHLVAHYQPDPTSSLLSRLVLAPDEDGDGTLQLHEVYGLDLKRANLVVLSACQSQLGQQSRGDDITGLNRAFMYAGAPTVIASLWNVDDQATSELMTSFYRHLRDGMGKAAALRAAQAEMRATYRHPYYWAGFVLAGHPGTTTN